MTKKITLLLFLLTAYFGYAQPTTDPTTPPTRDAGDVISIFCAEYTDVVGSDFNPNWGQSGFGSANTALDTGSGNLVLGYPNFNYQGVQFGSTQNIAAMEFLHVDIYINGSFNPNVFVISSGAEIAHPITNTGANTWISVDIAVSGITGDTSNAIQFKFDGGNGTTDAIYVDNLYFWKAPADPTTDATLSDLKVDGTTIDGFGPATEDYTYTVPTGTVVVPQITAATTTQAGASTVITQASAIPGDATVVVTASDNTTTKTYTVSIKEEGPAAAPTTPPARDVNDVRSVYSNMYTTAPTDGYQTFGGSVVTELDYSGNTILKATSPVSGAGLQYQYFGVSPQYLDLTDFDYMHIDFYFEGSPTTAGTIFIVIVQYSDGTNIQENFDVTSLSPDTWHEMDIAFADFDGNPGYARDEIQQIILQTAGPDVYGPFYFDNLYFHKNTTLGVEDNKLVSFKAYPNPTIDNWTIKSKNNTQIETIEVFDLLGKAVKSFKPNSSQAVIDGSDLISGLYFAQVKTTDGLQSLRLVKN
ncbi:T9SS type A sorting domain-containing protein [Seonamhaeicola sp.]|uniref:T9SS type A sorting domain-containing protein n=1 Tax=Seonamhaeicola sp. TaxID=1912245 RepID=UPI00260FD028|nr:T9SS type A sorting domain-containing protein [Seonamhaeicola sp.]